MFKVVLAATDGSGAGTRATETAANIASRYGAKLVLLSVTQPGALPHDVTGLVHQQAAKSSHPLIANIPSWFDTAREQVALDTGETHALVDSLSREALEHGRTFAGKLGVTDCQTIQEIGDPAATILDLAEKLDADLIVLGRRGLGGISRLLLGSVTYKVMQSTDRNCMTVK